MNSTDRISRYKAFKSFLETSQLKFEKIARSHKRVEELQSYHSLCICPGGSQGGINDRLLEVFYGQRPFDSQRTNPFDRKSIKVLVEYGARLHYNLLDNGKIVVILYPAQTDHFRPVEEAIVMSSNLDPRYLRGSYRFHFAFFNSYMRCTSLDGTPSAADKILVFLLRFTHPLIVDEKKQRPRVLNFFGGVFKFVMSVGLSGFLLTAIMETRATPAPDYSIFLEQLNKSLNTLSTQLQKMSERLAVPQTSPEKEKSEKSKLKQETYSPPPK